MVRLGVPAGVLAGWRRRGIGPTCAKLDHQEPFVYACRDVNALRSPLLGLGRYGLKLHGMGAPLQEAGGQPQITGEPTGPLMCESKMLPLLGISKRVAGNWRSIGAGPRHIRQSFSRPYAYAADDVADLRRHLLALGGFDISLPGLPPLKP
jgi:hypothetical protein